MHVARTRTRDAVAYQIKQNATAAEIAPRGDALQGKNDTQLDAYPECEDQRRGPKVVGDEPTTVQCGERRCRVTDV